MLSFIGHKIAHGRKIILNLGIPKSETPYFSIPKNSYENDERSEANCSVQRSNHGTCDGLTWLDVVKKLVIAFALTTASDS